MLWIWIVGILLAICGSIGALVGLAWLGGKLSRYLIVKQDYEPSTRRICLFFCFFLFCIGLWLLSQPGDHYTANPVRLALGLCLCAFNFGGWLGAFVTF